MWPLAQDWWSALYIILPIYCTNGAPVLFGGGRPIDGGRSLWDGQRVFGDHKTVRGFASGVLAGFIVGVIEYVFITQGLVLVAVLASFGALLGDLAGAFVKRRAKIKPGSPLLGLDQLDFVIGAILMVSIVTNLTLGTVVILMLVTPPVHFLTNYGAYKLGLKSTYW